MRNSFSTIDIQAREWFDKINGNSYFDCTVTFDFGLPTEQKYLCPFQYGYGSAYETAAMKVVEAKFPAMPKSLYELRKAGVIVRTGKVENCKKRELCNPTTKQINKAKKEGIDIYPFFDPKVLQYRTDISF